MIVFGAPSAASAGGSWKADAPPARSGSMLAQAPADPNATQGEGEEEDEEDKNQVPIPPNILEETPKAAPADTSGAAAPGDSAAISIPVQPALPETLRYAPPVDRSVAAGVVGAPKVTKRRGGLFGLGPVIIILGLAVVHFMVLKAVAD